MIRVAICDDDSSFLDKLEGVLKRKFFDYDVAVVVDKFETGINLLKNIENDKKIYDVIFLDLEMPAIHGFDVAKRLRELPNQSFLLIFLTYRSSEAPEGYEYSAFRFLLKGRFAEDIDKTINAIVVKFNFVEESNNNIKLGFNNNGVDDTLSVNKKDIIYFIKQKDRYVRVKTIYCEQGLYTKSLEFYKNELNDNSFEIFLRNHLINMEHIITFERGSCILTGGIEIAMGASKKTQEECKKIYMNYLTERIL